MKEPISIVAYKALLNSHDWYFEMSDDSRKYRKGHIEKGVLRTHSYQSPEHKELFDEAQHQHRTNQ